MKKWIAMLLIVALAFCCACTQQPATEPTAAPEATDAPEVTEAPEATEAPADTDTDGADKEFRVGIIQLTEHAALDAARQGFEDALNASGLNVTIETQNAQGEQTICATIATKFVNDKVDLILAIATPAAQAAAQATKDIPILVTAVTDPASSGLVESNDAPGGNVSGTSDMNPVKDQANLLVQLVPEAKTVGIMYHSSEDNSVLQAEMAQEALEALGLTVEIFTCADGTEVQAVAQSAASQVDALYIPTDNLMADTIATISMVCTPAGVPIICGESNMVDGGGTATYGIDYYRLGEQTAAQAIRILSEGADISTMPIEYYSAELELVVNEDVMAQLGLTVPESLQ